MKAPTKLLAGALLIALTVSSSANQQATEPLASNAPATRIAVVDSSLGNPVEFRLVWIESGSFVMGDHTGNGQQDELPLRTVTLSGFWMMQTEVTREMYAEFVQRSGHHSGDSCWIFNDGWKPQAGLNWRNPGFVQSDQHPVTCVSWEDSQKFIQWLNQASGLAFRLPSEAEWEYAARAGSRENYYFGEDTALLCQHANGADLSALKDYPGFSVNRCDDGFVRTSPVASFTPNPNGLYDIYGNVWEWVQDCWQTSYAQAPANNAPNTRGDCSRRGFRGGGYGDIPAFSRSSLRNRDKAHHRKDDIGFRLVLDSLPAGGVGDK